MILQRFVGLKLLNSKLCPVLYMYCIAFVSLSHYLDVWQEVTTKDAHQSLEEINHPVSAANGEKLDVAGLDNLTQRYLLGDDFLRNYFIIDLQEGRLVVGGSS